MPFYKLPYHNNVISNCPCDNDDCDLTMIFRNNTVFSNQLVHDHDIDGNEMLLIENIVFIW